MGGSDKDSGSGSPGGDAGDEPDSGTGSAEPDSGPDPVGVVVEVAGSGLPVKGAVVLFHDPAGELVERTETDYKGLVNTVVPDGSSVTVLTQAARLTTVQGVTDGDVIQVGTFQAPPEPRQSASVALPVYGPDTRYHIQSPCSRPNNSLNPTMTIGLNDCADSNAPLMATAEANEFRGAVFAYVLTDPVSLEPGVEITVPGPWQGAVKRTIALVNLPAVELVANATGQVRVRGRLVYSWQEFLGAASDGGLTVTFPEATLGDESMTTISICDTSSPISTQCQAVTRVDPGAAIGLNGAADLIPWTSGELVYGPSREVGLHWSVADDRPYDGTKIAIELRDVFEELLAHWEIVMPPGQVGDGENVLTLPRLPDDLRANWPDQDALQAEFQLTLMELARDASYAEFRRHAASDDPAGSDIRVSSDRSAGFGVP